MDVFGFFECPYRLFDVDDLMLNTSGAVLGFLVTLPLRKETEKFLRQEKFIIQKNILIL
jgi:putative membrane protein